jgi:FkbM family methyltransferase
MKNYLETIKLILLVAKKIKNWPAYFLDQKKLIKDKYVTYNFRNGQKVKTRAGTIDGTIIFENFIYNVYNPEGFELKKGDVVVDVGAHIGTFSIFASKLASKVYSFEPIGENFSLLQENIEMNKADNVYPFKMAVSKQNGETELFINDKNNAAHSSYMHKESKKVIVKTISFEDFVKSNNVSKIDFLKMDCEGAEYDIFFNCPKNILSMIGKISMECHNIDSKNNSLALKDFLQNNGFEVNIRSADSDIVSYLFAKNKKLA